MKYLLLISLLWASGAKAQQESLTDVINATASAIQDGVAGVETATGVGDDDDD